MLKKLFIIKMALCLNILSVKADEGMWLPLLLQENEADMQAIGLKLSAEDIYSINNSSLKDARNTTQHTKNPTIWKAK